MKVLNAKVEWMKGYGNDPYLQILVDQMPQIDDLVFDFKALDDGIFYFSVEDGYVSYFLHTPKNQNGYGGRVFKVKMKDGTMCTVKGPWSSNEMEASKQIGQPIVHVSMTHDPKAFERGYTFYAADVTLEVAQEAAQLAGVKLAPVARITSTKGALSADQELVVSAGLPITNLFPKWVPTKG